MRFKKILVSALAALSLSTGAASASMIGYDQLYVFGDSLSDVGNIYASSAQGIPVSPPYSKGRFSNGPVWVEDLADDAGLAVTPSLEGGNDFAYGGAQTGNTIVHSGAAIDLTSQLGQFQARNPDPSSTALAALWIGANDLNAFISSFQSGDVSLVDAGTFIDQATANVGDVVTGLASAGLNNLLALDVPDLAKTPRAIAAAEQTDNPAAALAQVSTLTRAFNQALAAELQSTAADSGIDLILGHTYDRIDQIVAHPGEYGFDNVADPCWTGGLTSADSGRVCDDPEGHLFWDGLHPTAHGHRIVADVAEQELGGGNVAVPEPGALGLFVLGVMLLAGFATRRPRARAL